jgi:hypothetical protein
MIGKQPTSIWLAPADREVIQAAAGIMGQPLSGFIRSASLSLSRAILEAGDHHEIRDAAIEPKP